MIIDEPPTETNGNGMPVIGATHRHPDVDEDLEEQREDDAAGDDRRERIGCHRDDPHAAPEHEQVEQEQDRRADEAALLGEQAKTKSVACSGR